MITDKEIEGILFFGRTTNNKEELKWQRNLLSLPKRQRL